MEKHKWRFSTQAVHGGHIPDSNGACVPPFIKHRHMNSEIRNMPRNYLILRKRATYIQDLNPTVAALRIKSLAGRWYRSLATSSGHAAVVLALLNICTTGDHIVSANNLYGRTYNLFSITFKKLGIKVSFVDPNDDAAVVRSCSPIPKHCLLRPLATLAWMFGF